jgi:hypothetical protein
MPDVTAASKLNSGCDVPATAATVTVELPQIDTMPAAPPWQETVVEDDQAVVMHTTISKVALAV